MEAAFSRVRPQKRVGSYVAEQIVDAIRAGKFAAGDKLLSERELARAMGVSRHSIRVALGVLSMLGIVETKVGDGTYIAHEAPAKVCSSLFSLTKAGVDVLGIWRAKEEIETLLLSDAIESSNGGLVAKLKGALQHMEEAVLEGSFDKFSISNVEFHLIIASVSKNAGLRRAEKYLLRVTQQIYRVAGVIGGKVFPEHLEQAYLTHKEIWTVLKERDRASVASAMRYHFDVIADFLSRSLNLETPKPDVSI